MPKAGGGGDSPKALQYIRRPRACKGAGRVKPQSKILPELRVPPILPAVPRPPAFSNLHGVYIFRVALSRASKSLHQEAIQNRMSCSASFFYGFWLQLGPNLAQTWNQSPPKIPPRSHPRCIQNRILYLIAFCMDFWSKKPIKNPSKTRSEPLKNRC